VRSFCQSRSADPPLWCPPPPNTPCFINRKGPPLRCCASPKVFPCRVIGAFSRQGFVGRIVHSFDREHSNISDLVQLIDFVFSLQRTISNTHSYTPRLRLGYFAHPPAKSIRLSGKASSFEQGFTYVSQEGAGFCLRPSFKFGAQLPEPIGSTVPKFAGSRTSESFRTHVGEGFVLFCEAQAFPPPSFR